MRKKVLSIGLMSLALVAGAAVTSKNAQEGLASIGGIWGDGGAWLLDELQ